MKVLGIDIGGTAVKAGIVDAQGNVSEKSKIFVSELRHGNVVDNILKWLEPITTKHQPGAVGIGIPGLLSKTKDIILEVPNLPEIEGANFIIALQSKFSGLTFYLANDANTAALGTYRFCKHVDTDTFGYLTIGTGVGSAIVLNGRLYEGNNGNGPELGMITLNNKATVDETSAKDGLLNICKELYPTYSQTTLLSPDGLTPEKLYLAADKGDALALKTFDKFGVNIGQALAVFIMLFDISTIYIGGGISPSFKFIQKPIKQRLEQELTDYYLNNLKIEEASLGNDSGILGAAALCFDM